MTPEQKTVIEKAARMLKIALKEFKRVVFHLAPEGDKDTVEYEIHGKTKVDSE